VYRSPVEFEYQNVSDMEKYLLTLFAWTIQIY
jgi:hypothetical protein